VFDRRRDADVDVPRRKVTIRPSVLSVAAVLRRVTDAAGCSKADLEVRDRTPSQAELCRIIDELEKPRHNWPKIGNWKILTLLRTRRTVP